MKTHLVHRTAGLLLAACGVLFSPALLAQETESVDPEDVRRGEPVVFDVDGVTVRLPVPDGWIVARSGEGTQLVLRAAGDDACQIEVKVTSRIPSRAATPFFLTFHTALKRSGLSPVGKRHGHHVTSFDLGARSEYALVTAAGKDYTMLVWEGHREGAVWIVTLFFPSAARDLYVDALEEVVKGFAFGE